MGSGFKIYIECGSVLSIGGNFKQILLTKFMFSFLCEVVWNLFKMLMSWK
jgi:hypothetical protein